MRLYRILFNNQGEVYEIYAKQVLQSDLYGFIEVSELNLESPSTLLLDPGTERMKSELKGVTRMMIPVHAIVRIDEVEKEGPAKIHKSDTQGKVATLPSALFHPPSKPKPTT